MRALRPPHALATLIVALIAYLGGQIATVWHEHAVLHVVCAEHGQDVEVQGTTATGDLATKADDGKKGGIPPQHDHHCAFASVAKATTRAPDVAAVEAPAAVELAPFDPVVVHLAPRGPPIAYAPKTSPPPAA